MNYKALLKNIKRLKRFSETDEQFILHKAMITHGCYRDSVFKTTMQQATELYDRIRRDGIFREMYHGALAALRKMGQDGVLLVKWYAGDRQKVIAEYQVSKRTMYRRVNAAEAVFENNMRRLGFDDEWFVATLGDLCQSGGQKEAQLYL